MDGWMDTVFIDKGVVSAAQFGDTADSIAICDCNGDILY